MPNRPVSPNWRWPEEQHTAEVQYTGYARGPNGERLSPAVPSEAEFQSAELFVPVSVKSLEQLRKDRDDLAAALAKEHTWSSNDPYHSLTCTVCPLLARIRGGG